MINDHILSFIVFFPLIVSGAIMLCKNNVMARYIALAGSVLTFLAGLHVWYHFDGSKTGLQFVENYAWMPDYGISYLVGVDGISLLMVVLTTFLTPLVILSLWNHEGDDQRSYLALIMFLSTGMLGALVAFDVVLFYVFWEIMLIPMYFIIGRWGGERRVYATTKFVIYTVVGSLLMLVAAIDLYMTYYQQFGVYSANLLDLYKLDLAPTQEAWLFGAFALAFAIKVPIWPLHTWLPDAHVQAPTSGSVILAGVLLKMGTYSILRFALPLFPNAYTDYAPLFMVLAVIGIILGALMAWAQDDAKKLVAYSSVSHLGFVILGSFAIINNTINPQALTGAVYQMINHGISTGALFFLVGCIYERRHTRKLAEFGGIAAVMPWFGVFLIVATMSSVGLPSTGGFVGEFLILLGTFQANPFMAILAVSGVLLGAIYMLTLCRRILFGPLDNEENKQLKDVSLREAAYLAPLCILAVVMGVFPNFFLGKVKASVEYLAKNYSAYELTIDSPSTLSADSSIEGATK